MDLYYKSTSVTSRFYSIKLDKSERIVEWERVMMSEEYVLSRKLATLSIKLDYYVYSLCVNDSVFHEASFKLHILKIY